MKIDLYTLCYNEEKIIPFVIDYWKYMNIHHVYVYDNGSTDKSLELLGQYPDWITINHFETNSKFCDSVHMNLKNNCWKGSNADYVIVCDFDEVLYCDDWDEKIQEMKDNGVTIIKPIGTQVLFEQFPNHKNGFLLNTMEGVRFSNDNAYSKCIMFNPKEIEEMNYCPGCHSCNPIGNVLYSEDKIHLFHLKYLSVDYTISKFRSNQIRLSDENKRKGWGIHYNWSDRQITSEFMKHWRNSSSTLI